MAAKHPRLGLNHLTVVPANFEKETEDADVADHPAVDETVDE